MLVATGAKAGASTRSAASTAASLMGRPAATNRRIRRSHSSSAASRRARKPDSTTRRSNGATATGTHHDTATAAMMPVRKPESSDPAAKITPAISGVAVTDAARSLAGGQPAAASSTVLAILGRAGEHQSQRRPRTGHGREPDHRRTARRGREPDHRGPPGGLGAASGSMRGVDLRLA